MPCYIRAPKQPILCQCANSAVRNLCMSAWYPCHVSAQDRPSCKSCYTACASCCSAIMLEILLSLNSSSKFSLCQIQCAEGLGSILVQRHLWRAPSIASEDPFICALASLSSQAPSPAGSIMITAHDASRLTSATAVAQGQPSLRRVIL